MVEVYNRLVAVKGELREMVSGNVELDGKDLGIQIVVSERVVVA